MNPLIPLAGIMIFLLAMCLHIIVWRRRSPENYLAALVTVLLVIPLILAGLFLYLLGGLSMSALDLTAVLMMHITLTGAYIMSYPAVQARSPTVFILLLIGSSMPRGSTHEELKRSFDAEGLREARVRDLVQDRLIEESKGYYSITWRGVLLLWPLVFLRRLLGLPKGKG